MESLGDVPRSQSSNAPASLNEASSIIKTADNSHGGLTAANDKHMQAFVFKLDDLDGNMNAIQKMIVACGDVKEREELEHRFQVLYGRDAASGDWKPSGDIPDYRMIALPYRYPRQGHLNLTRNLRAHMFWNLLQTIREDILDDGEENFMECLCEPGGNPRVADKVALFREEVVRRFFPSVQEYHSFMVQFVPDVRCEYFEFPPYLDRLSMKEGISLFEKEGDAAGVLLAKIFEFMYPVYGDDLLGRLNGISSNYRTMRRL